MPERSSWYKWWTSKTIKNNLPTLEHIFRCRNSNLVGDKIFDLKVVMFVSMFLNVKNVLRSFYSVVTVWQWKSSVSIWLNFIFIVGLRGNQHFVYDPLTNHILHVATRLCLDCDLQNKQVFMEECSIRSKTQQWSFFSYNETLILKDLRQFFW